MNVGKMRKKRECLLLLWLGHHYLLMSNNINRTTAAPYPEITRPFLPTVNGTSCHWIYSVRTSPTNTSKGTEDHLKSYYFEIYKENQSIQESATCFKNLIKCSSHPRIVQHVRPNLNIGISGQQRMLCIMYRNQSDCFLTTKGYVHIEKQGHVCVESKSKGNEICGNSRCSFCLHLKKGFVVDTETAVAASTKIDNGTTTGKNQENGKTDTVEDTVCVCPYGYKGAKCDQIEREHFIPTPNDFDSQLHEILKGYDTDDKLIVGITLVGLISVAFCGVFFVLVCCFYIFVKHVVISFYPISNENSIQMAIFPVRDSLDEEIANTGCVFARLKLCCYQSGSEMGVAEMEMDGIGDYIQ